MHQVSWNTVGDISFELSPDELIGIKFWGVTREEVNMNSGMTVQELLNKIGFVHSASVPQQKDWISDMSQEVLKKTDKLFRTDIPVGVEFDVKNQSFSFWRNTDCRNRGDFAPVACNPQARGFSLWRPCFCDTGNQQESTFIEKDQICSKSIGFFLYGAIDNIPNVEWLSRFSLLLSFPVSDSSTQAKSSASRDCQYNNGCQTVSGLPPQYVLTSTGPWDSLLPEVLSPTTLATSFFAIPKATQDVPVLVWTEGLFSLSSGKFDASVPQSSVKRPAFEPQNDMSFLSGADLSLCSDASVNFEMYHEVSCLIL